MARDAPELQAIPRVSDATNAKRHPRAPAATPATVAVGVIRRHTRARRRFEQIATRCFGIQEIVTRRSSRGDLTPRKNAVEIDLRTRCELKLFGCDRGRCHL